MDPFERRSGSERAVIRTTESHRPRAGKSHSRNRTPKSYRVCDAATGILICFMVVFTPWAFGTTEDWSIWAMNTTGFVLGGILLAKWIIRWRTGYRPQRWGSPEPDATVELFQVDPKPRDLLPIALAALTLLVLAYTLLSAVNARATYIEWQRRFEYRDCIRWLPHSYDAASTWNAFWMYSGLACFFWATRDWLLGKSSAQRRKSREPEAEIPRAITGPPVAGLESGRLAVGQGAHHGASESSASGRQRHRELPPRLNLLLWVLCLNGAILALEAILQRLSGTNKLLWLVVPRFNHETLAQFGPYAYRANAASYFNLIWPVCLGFWLVLREAAKPSLRLGHRLGSGKHLVLLPGAVLMAACPIISTSRGGALVAVGMIVIIMAILLWFTRDEGLGFRLGTCSLFAVILAFSAFLGLQQLAPRFKTIFTDQMSRRTEIYENALPIAHEFPVFGTGPGAFGALYQLYRSDVTQDWAAYVHDDWLETRITYGWVGFSLILLMLAISLSHWFFSNGIPARWEFTAMLWVAVGGCLLHAKFDFPLQVYSILFLLLLLCAILFCLSSPQQRR